MIIRDEHGGTTTETPVFYHHLWPCVPADAPHDCAEAQAKHTKRRGVITLRPAQEKEPDVRHPRRSP